MNTKTPETGVHAFVFTYVLPDLPEVAPLSFSDIVSKRYRRLNYKLNVYVSFPDIEQEWVIVIDFYL